MSTIKLCIRKARGAWIVEEKLQDKSICYEGWRHGVALSFEDARLLVVDILRMRAAEVRHVWWHNAIPYKIGAGS